MSDARDRARMEEVNLDTAGRCTRTGAVHRAHADTVSAVAVERVTAGDIADYYLRRCVFDAWHLGVCMVEMRNGRMIPILAG